MVVVAGWTQCLPVAANQYPLLGGEAYKIGRSQLRWVCFNKEKESPEVLGSSPISSKGSSLCILRQKHYGFTGWLSAVVSHLLSAVSAKPQDPAYVKG